MDKQREELENKLKEERERRYKLREERECTLFANLKHDLPALEELLTRVNDEWEAEEHFYRFYHHSFKVYRAQDTTLEIMSALRTLLPDVEINEHVRQLLAEGTYKEFQLNHNQRWLYETRPILEAFLHARFFLEMAVKYGRELTAPVSTLPSGWAAFLCLYNLRE